MINDGPNSLSDVLKEKHRIPKYQRAYAWKQHQIVELWEDLCEYDVTKDNKSKYIFGQIVVYDSEHDKTKYVIDGQQRLTTSYLFIAAVKKMITKIYPDRNNYPKKVDKYWTYLDNLICDMNSVEDDVPYLTVVKKNKDEFKSIIDLDIDLPNVGSESKMISAYSIFMKVLYAYMLDTDYDLKTERIDDYSRIVNNPDCFTKLKRITDTYLSFRIVYITVTRLVDAYRIFDTVNTRGIRLEVTDLVKNYVFANCYSDDASLNEDDISIENDWGLIVSSCGDDFNKFFRYVLIAKFGIVREDKLFDTVKEKIKDPDSIKLLLNEMKEALKIFLFVTRKAKVFSTEETNRIINGLTDSKKNMTVYMPVLMSFYLKSKKDKISDSIIEERALILVKALDVSFVRGLFAGKQTNYYEESFGSLSKDYYNGVISFAKLTNNVYNLSFYKDNEQLKKIFIEKNWENADARYILTELWNRTYPTNVVKCKTDIEHILPRTIKGVAGWEFIDEDNHKNNVKKIGNLILLDKSANRGLGNRAFTIKLKKYIEKRNQLLDTDLDYVISKTMWTPEDIKGRTATIVNAIVSSWPIIVVEDDETKTETEGELIIE